MGFMMYTSALLTLLPIFGKVPPPPESSKQFHTRLQIINKNQKQQAENAKTPFQMSTHVLQSYM